MAVTIGELTTEVIVENDRQLAGATPATTDKAQQVATIRTDLAAIGRDAMRTRAEGFDD